MCHQKIQSALSFSSCKLFTYLIGKIVIKKLTGAKQGKYAIDPALLDIFKNPPKT